MLDKVSGMTERMTHTGEPGQSAAAEKPPTPATRGVLLHLSRLSPRALFWALALGSVALSQILTVVTSLLLFHTLRSDIQLTILVAGAVTAAAMALAARYVVARLRMQQASLERFATVDELTGSPNRRIFLERLRSEIDRCSRLDTLLCLVFVDIDFFKRVNDEYGHQVGDAVLKEIYARLEESLRPYDFVGRYGGDEFVMALPGTDAEGGVAAAERLRLSVREGAHGKPAGVTISLGVAQLEKGMDADQLLGNADAALYRAKDRGRNRTEMHPRSDR
jgi:diguanylate cyclase (GGDEF)-like protein